MLLLVYGAVIVLCFVTFRSWRAVVVAVVPLVITSVLCEALMVALGIGVKVATLPVVALGVGIGIDYALYLLSVQLAAQRAGATWPRPIRSALRFTGKVVVLVGVTLAAGVATWTLSPIKFQADMGPAARLHVRLEHGRRGGADPGDVALPAARGPGPAAGGGGGSGLNGERLLGPLPAAVARNTVFCRDIGRGRRADAAAKSRPSLSPRTPALTGGERP
jgi:hypothetical protein